ncbi:porin [Flavobacterium sp. RSSA_27]|uniref:porin n=1 Tax=Flavobacterium sp. RSSA_27 TaxID=3447667 RepID=UPI003F376664
MKKIIVAIFLSNCFVLANAQEKEKSPFTFSGYLEAYYSYDFGQPDDHLRPDFVYSHNKHNEVNLNLGIAKVNFAKEPIRANFALMTGTYTQYNMAAEPTVLQPIFEANLGVKLSKKHHLWLDAGIIPSHIGFESAIGKDCQTLTRSILADNSPYFETGVKLSYTSPSGQWYWAGMYLNGWQRIQKIEGNQTPAFGSQILYKPTSKITFNWSTYVGNEQPDGLKQWRYFSNLYGQLMISDQLNVTAGFDLGTQQSAPKSDRYDSWLSPVLIVQYKPIQTLQMAARAEYYQDVNGVIIASTTPNGFTTYGFSANVDYFVAENVVFRVEARNFSSKDAVFSDNGNPSKSNTFLTTSLAVSF